MSFFKIKMENRKAKQVLSGVGTSGRRRIQGKGVGGEYGRNIMFSCVKMEK
jgi:hypothetical protein